MITTGAVLAVMLSAQPAPSATLPADDVAAVREIRANLGAARRSLDDLLVQLDASVHSERSRPERRRVQFDQTALDRGLRVASIVAAETGDRSYLRRFRARERRLAGTALLNDGHFSDAMAPLSIALSEARVLGDTWLETITRLNLAYGHLELGSAATALIESERAFELARGLDDKARALTFVDLASVHLHLENFERSVVFSKQAIELSHTVGIRTWEGNSFLNLGVAHEQLGDLVAAQRAFENARAILEHTNDRPSLGRSLYNLGLVAARQEQYADAARYLEQALPIIRAVDIRHSHDLAAEASAKVGLDREPTTYQNPIEVSALRVLVEAYLEVGDVARAAAHVTSLRQVEARPRMAGDKPQE